MITIDLYAIKDMFFGLVAECDLVLAAKTILTVSPLVSGFVIALKMFGGKRVRVGFGFPLVYLAISSIYFAFAYADAVTLKKTFPSEEASVITSVATFVTQFVTYLCFVSATKAQEKPKKKYVARVAESPIPHAEERERKAYKLNSNKIKPDRRQASFDNEEFLKFIQKIGEKKLSFFDEEEYNNIVTRSKFLSGVAVTDKTAPEFCELFLRSIKLAARYESD